MKMQVRRRHIARIVIAIAACLVVFGAASVVKNLLASETAQAHAFVAEGQRELAKGDRASAALAFERARLVAPRAYFVRSSIAEANVKDAETALPRALRIISTREWAAIAIGAGWICGLAIALALVRRPNRPARRVAITAGAMLALGVGAIVESNASAPAIVTAADVHLLVAPYATATVEAPLSAGTMVVVGPPYDGYVHVEDADGHEGWIPQKSIEPIASKG